jgi:catechol 2,3-dioxygenase-like lactoylglutathione lyase family enzyme
MIIPRGYSVSCAARARERKRWFATRAQAHVASVGIMPQHRHGGGEMDWRLELVSIPVTDVDRAKAFYTDKAGFTADHDHAVTDELRFVQLTPPGSACSIALGTGITGSAPGSAQVQLVVTDVVRARAELLGRRVDVSEVQEFPWGSFVFFADPDGNRWAVQQLPARD